MRRSQSDSALRNNCFGYRVRKTRSITKIDKILFVGIDTIMLLLKSGSEVTSLESRPLKIQESFFPHLPQPSDKEQLGAQENGFLKMVFLKSQSRHLDE